jgi:hypothetical protein
MNTINMNALTADINHEFQQMILKLHEDFSVATMTTDINREFPQMILNLNKDFERKLSDILGKYKDQEQPKQCVDKLSINEKQNKADEELVEELVEKNEVITDDVSEADTNHENSGDENSGDENSEKKKTRGRPKKNKDVKSVLEVDEIHDTKEPKAKKEPKEPKAKKEPKEPKAKKEPKEPKAKEEPKEPKEPKAKKEPKEPKTKNDEKILNVIEVMVNDNTPTTTTNEPVEKENTCTDGAVISEQELTQELIQDDEEAGDENITYNGIVYVKTKDNLMFLKSTNEHIGTWNNELESIEILNDENDE